jgi:DNA-binding XRE family transcriptional regulator
MIEIRIREDRCIIDKGVWASDNLQLQAALNIEQNRFEQYIQEGGDPNPELSAAIHISKLFNGKLLNIDKHNIPKHRTDVVY